MTPSGPSCSPWPCGRPRRPSTRPGDSSTPASVYDASASRTGGPETGGPETGGPETGGTERPGVWRLLCGACKDTNTTRSGPPWRRSPPGGTRGTTRTTGRYGAGRRMGGSSPRWPASPRAGPDVGCARAPTTIWLARMAGRLPPSTSPMWRSAGRAGSGTGRRRDRLGLRGRPAGDVPGPFVRPLVDAVPGAAQGRGRRCGAGAARARAPGGLLLAVYHDLDDEHREHMKSRGVDPADYVGADDLVQLLGDDFTRSS